MKELEQIKGKLFDVSWSAKAQYLYCHEHSVPLFAPPSGRCYSCGRNIYDPYMYDDGHVTGIDVAEAYHKHITGCPHCKKTFCD